MRRRRDETAVFGEGDDRQQLARPVYIFFVEFDADIAWQAIAIGVSAALNGSTQKPDPAKKTGGIRSSREDGNVMWDFALYETKVVVVR